MELSESESKRLEALSQYQVLDTTPEASFDKLTRLAAYICQTPLASISLSDDKRQWFKSKVGFISPEELRNLTFCSYAILEKELFIVPDTWADERFKRNYFVTSDAHNIRFYAAAPLITPNGLALGTLCVLDYVPRQLSSEQQEALTTLAVQVVTQLELRRNLKILEQSIAERQQTELALQQLNANLERQVQERTAQLQQALAFEAMLKRITDKVRDSLDESQILQTAVQELALAPGVTCCNTALYNLEEGTSTICYEYASSNPAAQARVMHIASFPEVYQQLLQCQYCQFCSLIPNPIRGRVAMLACPIFDDQGVLGDLWLINQQEHTFNDLEIRMVQQVANQCAIAIRQARLYQAAKAQVKELEKLNQLKDDFLSTVSHELRTPLTNIKMAIQMLKIASAAEQIQRYLEILQNECTREIELINDLLDLQQLEAVSLPCSLSKAVNIQDWLPKIIEPFQARIQERQIELQINIPPELPMLVCDLSSLERVLAELLNNACKYTLPREKITVAACVQGDLLQVHVSNSGVEIPSGELSRIFDKFYRIPGADPWQQGGTGLGLALVKKLIEHLEGKVSVESCFNQTRFIVELPINSANTAPLTPLEHGLV